MIRLRAHDPVRIVSVGAFSGGAPFDACDPGSVARVCGALGFDGLPRQAPQEHGTRIDRLGDGLPCDAFLVEEGQAALVRHADCMPIVVYDPTCPRAVIAHCGWKGILAELPAKCAELLLSEGSRPEDLRTVAGPAIGPGSFEVAPDFQGRFPSSTWTTTTWGTPAVDLAAVVALQWKHLGLLPASWHPPEIDTFSDPGWHSHRRTHTPRRNATICWIPPAGDRTRTIRNLLLP